MALTEVILLQRMENLGQMGDIVRVRPGYARNFLLPEKKALRATNANKAHFEAQRKTLEAENLTKKADAETVSKKLDGLTVTMIRQAAEGGQLYGSVSTRDIADIIATKGFKVERNQVVLNQSIKTIGLFPLDIMLHPEVKVKVTINIARTEDEAKMQEKTGKALLADAKKAAAAALAETEAAATSENQDSEVEADAPAPKAKKARKKAASTAEVQAETDSVDAA